MNRLLLILPTLFSINGLVAANLVRPEPVRADEGGFDPFARVSTPRFGAATPRRVWGVAPLTDAEEADDSLYVVGESDDEYDGRWLPVEEGCSAQTIVQTLQLIFTGNPLKALPDDVIFFYMVPGNRDLFVCRQKTDKKSFFFLSGTGDGFSALMPASRAHEFNEEWPCVLRDDVNEWGMFREPARYDAPLEHVLDTIPEGNEPVDEEAAAHN